jgi:hypothetical protein
MGMSVRTLDALVVELALLGAACSGDDDSAASSTAATTTTTTPAQMIDCRAAIGAVATAPTGYAALRDAAAFVTSRVLQTTPQASGVLFAKSGLLVRAVTTDAYRRPAW